MFYYKVYNTNNENFIGIANSLDLRYYNLRSKKLLCCTENLAQYIVCKGQIYRIHWFQDEFEEMKNTYPSANLELISREEYDEYMAEMAKVESEQK